MTFKPAIWYPIAVLLSVSNLIAVAFTAGPAHATIHAALALAFGVWAHRLRQSSGGSEHEARLEGREELEALKADVSRLRQDLIETQERLDFAERLLAQRPEARRVGPQR